MKNYEKKIAMELYRYGLSKDNIYKTMKEVGYDIRRKDVRELLYDKSLFNSASSKYRERLKKITKERYEDVRKAKERLNHNYLAKVTIELIEKKEIRYNKKMKTYITKMPNEEWSTN